MSQGRDIQIFLVRTSSFVDGEGTIINDSLVVKASGGQTLTMVYIYCGSPLRKA